MKNYYKILGIKSYATPKEIDAAYEKLLDWQEQFPDSYPEERRRDIDEAYDVLRDPASRKAYDQELRQQPTKSLEKPQFAGHRDPAVSGPPPPPESEYSKRTWQRLQGRMIVGGIVLLIIAFRACTSSGVFNLDLSASTEESPTLAVVNTNTPRPTNTPNIRSTQTAVVVRTQEYLNTPCIGLTIADTHGYAADQTSQVQDIPANTTLTFRPSSDGDWFILSDKTYGEFVPSGDVQTTLCRAGLDQQYITPTATLVIIPIGQQCRLRNVSGGKITVYEEKDRNSATRGLLEEFLTFYAIREPDGWFRMTGPIAVETAGGYILASEVETITCTINTVTPAARATSIFGG